MSYSLAGVTFDVTFKYKDGKLKRVSTMDIYNVTSGQTLTANKSMTAYTSSSCKKKSFTISKGMKVYISSLAYKSGKLAIKVTAGGKSGWISAAKSYSSTYPFKELMYAG